LATSHVLSRFITLRREVAEHAEGTKGVHQLVHAHQFAGTRRSGDALDLQDKRARECLLLPALPTRGLSS